MRLWLRLASEALHPSMRQVRQLVSAHALIICKLGLNARPRFQFIELADLAYNDDNLPGVLDYLKASTFRNGYTENDVIVALTPQSCDNTELM